MCLSVVSGIAAIVLALLMPAHLRAIDPHVLAQLGARGHSLVQKAAQTAIENPAVAKLLLTAAEELKLAGTDQVIDQLRETSVNRTRTRTLLEQFEAQASGRVQVTETTVLASLRKAANREQLTASLQSVEAKQILKNRSLTNLVLFAPVKSAAGLPLDVSILTAAFLMEPRAVNPAFQLRDELLRVSGNENQRLEETYLSLFALAKRLSSEQLIAFVARIPNLRALHTLTRYIQEKPGSLALVYSCVITSKHPGAVGQYLDHFPATAENDLSFALTSGSDALDRLLHDQQPVYRCGVYEAVSRTSFLKPILSPLIALSSSLPTVAAILKLALLALGAFLLATSLKFRKKPLTAESYVVFPQYSLLRRCAFASVFLLLAVVLGEPYLAQGNQTAPKVRWSSPLLAAAAPAPAAPARPSTSMIDQHTILAITTFLVLQGLIYAVCLVKLAEIRKQPVPSALKLKLLENEDNLFDGGLYCGLFGTAASLILLTLGVIKPSLVAAYSSTLFGILFVALLKIGHVRPYKRRLLLDTPAELSVTPAPNPFS